MIRFACWVVAMIPVSALATDEILPYEVSKDGQVKIFLHEMPAETPTVAQGLPGSLPYNSTPDWENDIRRQVGGIVVCDMNGDGWDDIVCGCYNTGAFPPYEDWRNFVYFNTGGALEASPSWHSSDQVSTGMVAVGDLNNDTFPDVYAANGTGARSVIYFGTASGPNATPGWTSAIPQNAWNNYAVMFDIDHDNDLDIMTANQGFSQFDPHRPMFLFRNNDGVVETVPSWQSAETSLQNYIAFADYDGDGWEDMAVSKWAAFETGIYKNVAGTLQTTPIWTTGLDGTDKGVAWADVDGNDWPDLVVGRNPTGLYSNDAGTLSQTWTGNPPFFSYNEIAFEDVDRDGDMDLAEIHFGDGRAHIYLNDDGVLSTTPSWTFDSPTVGASLAFGDINGDNWPDLILGYAGDPSIRVFYNQLAPETLPGDLNCDGVVSVGDINPFVLALTDPTGYANAFPDCNILNGDCSDDGAITVGDINCFVTLVTDG